ncbi:MAG TPA: hypothetical protein VHF86_02090 [Xanthomonadaceae bacterium]|nr:hypothetical protein [Xanthomonadaceae bacterium]
MSDPRILPHERTPSNWGEAFAAMPSEAPDADAWPRIARAAWSQPRRPAWPAWLAAAAVLAVVVVLPWRLAREPETQSAAPVAARAVPAPAATARAANADAAQAGALVATVSRAGPDAADDEGSASTAPSSPIDGLPNARQRIARTESAGRDPAAQEAMTAATQADNAPADIANASPRLATDADADAATPADSSASGSELEQLYAESAQLEALVAMARDDRVATTGAAAALASQYDAQVADIDGRLIQPDVTPEERTRLWRARVAALRELAGFESTQRLLAAHGERYDAMLVSID